jgi:hypothetical protein
LHVKKKRGMGIWIAYWIFLAINAAYDAAKWDKTTGLEHWGRFLIRGMFFAFLAFVPGCPYPCNSLEAFKTLVLMSALFWVVFDILVNLLHFKSFAKVFHLGSTAITDYFFRAIWGVADTYSDRINETAFMRRELGALITQYVVKAAFLFLAYQYYLSPINFKPWQLIL